MKLVFNHIKDGKGNTKDTNNLRRRLKMDEESIEMILELYGLDRILEDNRKTLIELIDILVVLGYLDLEMYEGAEV